MSELAELAGEAAAILAAWPDHEEQCDAYYCGFETCTFVDEMEGREVTLLKRLAALLPAVADDLHPDQEC